MPAFAPVSAVSGTLPRTCTRVPFRLTVAVSDGPPSSGAAAPVALATAVLSAASEPPVSGTKPTYAVTWARCRRRRVIFYRAIGATGHGGSSEARYESTSRRTVSIGMNRVSGSVGVGSKPKRS